MSHQVFVERAVYYEGILISLEVSIPLTLTKTFLSLDVIP